jgi:CMP-N-acetylneuraminic acid synthetase
MSARRGVVGLITARGGSKGIPRKNIAVCAGKPLIAWTCEAARAARTLTRVIVSTDDDEIAAVARGLGIEVPFLRPAVLAADATPALPVVQHALDWLESAGVQLEALVLLQPTSPLRRAEHVDEAVELFRRSRADTVVSVVEVPHRYHPASVLRERDGVLVPYHEGTETVTRRQGLEPLLARNGPAVLVMSPATLRSGCLYGARTVGYRMRPADSLDVDDGDDLILAGLLLAARTSSVAPE